MSEENNERLRKTEGRIKKKRKRTTEGDNETAIKKSQNVDQSDDFGDEEADDLPKKPKEPSKRQLKREKAEKMQALQKEASQLGAAEKAITYISKWKHAKSDWKFEKLRQIWLVDHLLDNALLPDNIFPTVLEYFEGCKGSVREQLVKKMMEVIKKVEDIQAEKTEGEEEDEENPSIDTAEYQRARQVLQALPTEVS